MKTFTDVLLTKIDQNMQRLAPLNTLVDKVVSRVAPGAVASACGGATSCGYTCYSRSSLCGYEGGWYVTWWTNDTHCSSDNQFSCSVGCAC